MSPRVVRLLRRHRPYYAKNIARATTTNAIIYEEMLLSDPKLVDPALPPLVVFDEFVNLTRKISPVESVDT
jgi:hypothetical protein